MLRFNGDDLDTLLRILLSVRTLKRFIFESAGHERWDHSPAEYIPPGWFARALEPHQATLVDLVIAGDDTGSFHRMPLFRDFATYSNLKRLAIPEKFLVQRYGLAIHEWLPPSLEVLQLQLPLFDSIKLDEERPLRFARMELLAEHKLACFPALTRVIWWIQRDGDWNGSYLQVDLELMNRMDQLATKFKAIGVKFKLIVRPCLARSLLGKAFEWYYT